jgi:hypothetical protein
MECGMTRGVNEGILKIEIIEHYREGVVRSVFLAPTSLNTRALEVGGGGSG